MENLSATDPFANLSMADKEEIWGILQERRKNNRTPLFPGTDAYSSNRVDILPNRNGKQEDFNFYMDMLRTRVEKGVASCREPSGLCIDIINTLPDDKRSRIASWFSVSKKANKFDSLDLLNIIEHEFEDTHAQQVATELLQRMEQGRHQFFREFLKDFEYKVSLSGGDIIFTPSAKTRQLKLSLNSKLRRVLIGVKLPPEMKYHEWVVAVNEVAVELESFTDYRPRGSKEINTKIGPPKGGSTAFTSEPSRADTNLDGNGDTYMSGTDAILAAIRDLKLINKGTAHSNSNKKQAGEPPVNRKKEATKPRAPWRNKKEFNRLIEKGVCVRCGKEGHRGPKCPNFRSAKRPRGDLSQLEEGSSDDNESDSDSGNEIA